MSGPGRLSATGTSRELHDAAFDGIHQREIANSPREECSFGITGTAKEKRRGGKIVDRPRSYFAVQPPNAAPTPSRTPAYSTSYGHHVSSRPAPPMCSESSVAQPSTARP